MVLLSAVSDAFSNPDSPWYYVVGTAFLVLIFAALAVYVILSRRKSKRDAQDPEKSVSNDEIKDTVPPNGEQSEESHSDSSEQPVAENEAPAEEKSEEKEEIKEEAPAPVAEEKAEESVENQPEPENPPVSEEKPAEKEPAPVKKQTTKTSTTKAATKTTAAKSSATKSSTAKSTATKTTAAKKKPTQKAFIDRLIATTEVHAVYNELKNTVLSYPGIKAKLTKENETFLFGEEKKARLALNGMNIELYLSVDKSAVPSQFGVEQGDDELPTKLTVDEIRIDDAQKLIVFAMNVSMLTRNDKHRHVNYIQNAIKAKEKSATKK